MIPYGVYYKFFRYKTVKATIVRISFSELTGVVGSTMSPKRNTRNTENRVTNRKKPAGGSSSMSPSSVASSSTSRPPRKARKPTAVGAITRSRQIVENQQNIVYKNILDWLDTVERGERNKFHALTNLDETVMHWYWKPNTNSNFENLYVKHVANNKISRENLKKYLPDILSEYNSYH
jgi:hypothetical protein